MKESSVKIYIAEDGERFKDREECLEYESTLHLVKDLQERYLYPLPENKVVEEQFKEGLCYIQHSPELFEAYKRDLFHYITLQYILVYMPPDLGIRDLPAKEIREYLEEFDEFKQRVWDLDDSSLDLVSGYLNAKAEQPYSKAWERVINTDESYREWYDWMFPWYDEFNRHTDQYIEPIALNR